MTERERLLVEALRNLLDAPKTNLPGRWDELNQASTKARQVLEECEGK